MRNPACTPRVLLLLLSLLTQFVGACGEGPVGSAPPSSSNANLPLPGAANPAKDTARVPTALVFAGVDPLALPWQASVYALDLENHELKLLLSGESGDPLLFKSADELLLFNRSADSQNYRRLRADGASWLISPQLQFPIAAVGDPKAGLYLGGDHLLLAHYTAGKLTLVEQSRGQAIAELSLEPNSALPSPEKLRIESLFARTRDDGQEIVYAVHQGLGMKDGLLRRQGSGLLYELKPASRSMVARHGLHGTLPVALTYPGSAEVMLVSLCSRFLQADTEQRPCQAAIESFHAANDQVRLLWDLQGQAYFMNGPIFAGSDPACFYAQVEHEESAGRFVKKLVEFDTRTHSVRELYRFPAGSGGFWASFYDQARNLLWIGDHTPQGGGEFVLLDPVSGAVRHHLPLAHAPLSGALL